MPHDVTEIASHFAINGRLTDVVPFSGHINDSFILTCELSTGPTRFLLQRINEFVFHQPAELMENIQRVTAHIKAKLEANGATDIRRRVLTLIPTHDGETYHRDETNGYWRFYRFIEGARSQLTVETCQQAESVGRAFGGFQAALADFPGPRLHDTIPDFHNTPQRYQAFDDAVRADVRGRAADARTEIELARHHRPLAGALLDLHRAGAIPERIVHNDAKISNVLFDEHTGEALCVVDLDTVMPGLSLYDFGDMVRSMTTTAAEDETDLARVEVELPLFEALARGYLATAGAFLAPAERENLVTAGKLITLEQAVRFLTDHLAGDPYYKTHRANHNLERTRTQFKLLESIERHEIEMNRVVGTR